MITKDDCIKFISYCELSEPSMKAVVGEKKQEWKKDVNCDRIVVSEVDDDVSKSITSLSSLPLHHSNESILKNSGNFITHNGTNRYESLIINKALLHVCFLYYFCFCLYFLFIVGYSSNVCYFTIVLFLFYLILCIVICFIVVSKSQK